MQRHDWRTGGCSSGLMAGAGPLAEPAAPSTAFILLMFNTRMAAGAGAASLQQKGASCREACPGFAGVECNGRQ